MAETLIQLTNFKLKFSSKDLETVGGPIDVAVISKGDGFVWVKRKHYFEPELNYQFFKKKEQEYEKREYYTRNPKKPTGRKNQDS